MVNNHRGLKKLKVPVVLAIGLLSLCVFSAIQAGDRTPVVNLDGNSIQANNEYDGVNATIQDQVINDNIIVRNEANVSIVNSTINGNIYAFNTAHLTISENATIDGEIFITDDALLSIDNSTILDSIQCSENANFELSSSNTSTIQKSDLANVTTWNSTIEQIMDLGSGGQINCTQCQVTSISLTGFSQTFLNSSTVGTLSDFAPAYSVITGPVSPEFTSMGYDYSTSEREVNLTWFGFDNLVVDGFLNISFKIFIDGNLYTEINGSGYYDRYDGQCTILLNETGDHEITLVSIDGNGLNTTSSIPIGIIDYPVFDGVTFWTSCIVIAGAIIIAMWLFKRQQDRGFQSALDVVFKQELQKSKIKLPVFVAIGAAPGLILFFIFSTIQRIVGGNFSMDNVRSLISLVYSMYQLYFGIAFSMAFAVNVVVKDRNSGALSWFLSKPVRRWEYLWGKILSVFFAILLISISTSVSFMLSGISFVDPIYIPDMISIGGFMFLNSMLSLLPLAALVILFSTIVKKTGLAIFLPILIAMLLPVFISFLPLATRHEWPMLLSLTYYSDQLSMAWISNSGGLLGSISQMGQVFGIEITTLNLTVPDIVLILSSITIVSLGISTIAIQRGDI